MGGGVLERAAQHSSAETLASRPWPWRIALSGEHVRLEQVKSLHLKSFLQTLDWWLTGISASWSTVPLFTGEWLRCSVSLGDLCTGVNATGHWNPSSSIQHLSLVLLETCAYYRRSHAWNMANPPPSRFFSWGKKRKRLRIHIRQEGPTVISKAGAHHWIR